MSAGSCSDAPRGARHKYLGFSMKEGEMQGRQRKTVTWTVYGLVGGFWQPWTAEFQTRRMADAALRQYINEPADERYYAVVKTTRERMPR